MLLKQIPGSAIINLLGQIHIGIEKKYHQPKLNGYYVTPDGLSTENYFTSFFGKAMSPENHFETDSILLFELKSASYTMYGTPAKELPMTMNIDDVLNRLNHNINNYWSRWIKTHSGFKVGYLLLLLFPGLTEWGVLGLLRQLYTLETGKIISKSEAGNYYLHSLPTAYQPVIVNAIETRKVNSLWLKPSFKRAKQTIDCMAFIRQRFNTIYLGDK